MFVIELTYRASQRADDLPGAVLMKPGLMEKLSLALVIGLAACGGDDVSGGGGEDGGSSCGDGRCDASESDGSCAADCADAQPAGQVCTNPVFTTSDPNGGWSDGGYYVHNNMWNCGDYACDETLSACSYSSFYVTANMDDESGDGAVKSYPNVHKDYEAPTISSFSSLTSTFAATSPQVGIYNLAYDIWLNGVATPDSTEIMIWTENYNQVPAGDQAATVTLGGADYDVYRTGDGHYIAFVPSAIMTSGGIDLLELFDWVISQGWITDASTIGQIGYGVEIVSTDDSDARFDITDFSLTER